MKLSVVIPVFNESKRLPHALAMAKKYSNWEFIFVNDGSTDSTPDLIKKSGYQLISYGENQGKGYALKQGVLATTQPYTLITDVDFSTPLTEFPKLFKTIKEADIAIGSRKMIGAKIIEHQSWWREFLGRQFTNLSRLWLKVNVSDFTCGFKLFKTPVAKKLFALSKIKRWGYDAEILFLAKKLNYKIAEVPVVWQNDKHTKVSLLPDVIRSLLDLVLIRAYHA